MTTMYGGLAVTDGTSDDVIRWTSDYDDHFYDEPDKSYWLAVAVEYYELSCELQIGAPIRPGMYKICMQGYVAENIGKGNVFLGYWKPSRDWSQVNLLIESYLETRYANRPIRTESIYHVCASTQHKPSCELKFIQNMENVPQFEEISLFTTRRCRTCYALEAHAAPDFSALIPEDDSRRSWR